MICPQCGHENPEANKFCGECAAPLGVRLESAREVRKTVTVVFCDVTGSTALGEAMDPEALRALLARYFDRMRRIVEAHGGTVEKFIGDAVMAVFGVPTLHEDDALRAVRSAAEMRDALPGVGVQGRIGVATGEVVTGTQERLATGDAVNVAARLEQAAEPGEILMGADTLRLAGDSVVAEPVEPLQLKGKRDPVPAFRLLRVRTGALAREHGMRFVGRDRELGVLEAAWQSVRAERRFELVTVTGDAGVGKSRLVAEFLASIDATIVQGRCLPYGEGITYWPVVEVLKQVGVMPTDGAAASAIRSLLGDTTTPTSADEIAWAFRKALEHAGSRWPVVATFDDIQWGEDTFLDLVEHVALLATGAPVMVVCLARPELLERRPAWPVTLRLGPLGSADVIKLLPEQIHADLRAKIAAAAGGNPLFLAEMVAMTEKGSGEVVVPPTLRALLGARLDQLEPAERHVLECGAIEGEIFHSAAVTALARDQLQLSPRLAALVRKGLIAPDRAQIPGDDGFRFRHLLIRDAAYESLPKTVRAELHHRFALWLDEHGAGSVELDEIVGYHLERACAYRAELGLARDDQLAVAARRRLAAAGHRAYLRGDYGAATSLLERAAALTETADLDLGVEADLIEALLWGGRGRDALKQADSLIERATEAGDQVLELCGRIKAESVRLNLEPEGVAARLEAIICEALPVFQTAGNNLALSIAHSAMSSVAQQHARLDQALDESEQAFAFAPDAAQPEELFARRALLRMHGATPLTEFLRWLDEPEQHPRWNAWHSLFRGLALAMLGNFGDARALVADARSAIAERSGGLDLAFVTGESATVELYAGDLDAAVAFKTEACHQLERFDESGFYSTMAASLARMLCELDRLDEAHAWIDRARQAGGTDDAETQLLWRRANALILARQGIYVDAQRLAREAVEIAQTTDLLNLQADSYSDLGDVFTLSGDTARARTPYHHALDCYERKENRVMAQRTRSKLAAIAQD